MNNARKTIIALSAFALVGGAFLASASDAEARGRGGNVRGGNFGKLELQNKEKGFGGNRPTLNKDNFGQLFPAFPDKGGAGKPPAHHRHAGQGFRVGGVGFAGATTVIDDGCVLEKRLVRGVPRMVKVCPTF